jgi:hypothetical protein
MRTPHDIVMRLRREYQEMPGLSLTDEQVQRLCSIEPLMCKTALQTLVSDGFLTQAANGQYRHRRPTKPSAA